MEAHSIYIHIPFCEKRCSYCDFNTYAGINHLIPVYVKGLVAEIDHYGQYFDGSVPVKTIFFGGGTPSLLTSDQLTQIINTVDHFFDTSTVTEISLEANPGTVNLEYLKQLKRCGFSRISFGVQSIHQRDLNLMGRIHSHIDSIQAVEWARAAGFDNLNIDLIYGLPNQSVKEWLLSVEEMLRFQPEHISMYALGVEEGTPLYDWIENKQVNAPDDDLSVLMYEQATALLNLNQYEIYEISNFARNDPVMDFRCVHNLQYWRNLPYIGIGAGAHGFIENTRTENIKTVGEYINAFKNKIQGKESKISPAIDRLTIIDSFTEMQETMMVGLRLIHEGVSIQKFVERFGSSPISVFSKEFDELLSKKLISIGDDQVIRINPEKIMLSNQIFRYFV